MNFFEEWVDIDLNPIISFSSTSKVLYSNTEAQFLLGKIEKKEIFNLAVTYASKTYGKQTTYVDIKLGNYTFYAITVMYENEDEIYVKLYKSSMAKKNKNLIGIDNINMSNIFTLSDLAISNARMKYKTYYIKDYDPSIPEFKLDSNLFIKKLTKIFGIFKNTNKVTCSIKLKIGEYIKIDNKKYSLISIIISTDELIDTRKFLSNFNMNNSLILTLEKNKAIIDLPLIL